MAAGAAILVVHAAVLVAVAVPAPHSGGDNMAYLALGHALAEGLGYVELWDPSVPPHTKYPPAYPLVLAGLILAGATSWSAFKLSSALALTGSALLVFAWAARRTGILAGAAVVLLLALAAGWQEASRWILSEPWFLLWTFLTFWAADRALGTGAEPAGGRPPPSPGTDGRRSADVGEGRSGEAGGSRPGNASGPRTEPARTLWLMTTGAGALMAFGVRSAGIPVVLAFLLALVLRRRLRAAGVFAAVTALMVGGWLLRASRGGEGAYQSEFWLLNPYEPELGTVGPAGLVGRVGTNFQLYVGEVLPSGWWGGAPPWALWVAGGAIGTLALAGWIRRVRGGPGAAEIFAPLYAGMILLWPEVWSGDRFLLPLLPLALLYAGEAGAAFPRSAARGRGGGGRVAALCTVAAGVLVLALPAVAGTLDRSRGAADCRARVETSGDAFACYGRGILEFRAAAAWMGVNLPAEAVVLSRKPRILFVLDGPRGRTFPFTRDPDRFLEAADRAGARYVLVDHWDGIASLYLIPVVSARPGAFCYLAAWGSGPEAPGTTLLGILPPDSGRGDERSDLERCPPGWASDGGLEPRIETTRVPLLVSRRGREIADER